MASTKLASSTVSPASAKARRMPEGKGISCHGWLPPAPLTAHLSWGSQMQSQATNCLASQRHLKGGTSPGRGTLPSLGRDQTDTRTRSPAQALPKTQEHGRSMAHRDTQGTNIYTPMHTSSVSCVLIPSVNIERSRKAQPQEQLLAEPGVLTHIPIFQGELSFSARTGGKWQIYCHSILQ